MRKQKILALVGNTFQKEYRSKTLIFLFLFTLMIVFMVNAFMDIFVNAVTKSQLFVPGLMEEKLKYFYLIISMWGGFLATILGVNCVRSDYEHNVAAQILSFPIKKFDFLLARISGTWLIVMSYYLFSLLFAFLIFSFSNRDWSFGLNIPGALLVNGMGLLAVITFGVIFSFFFSKLLSFLGVFFLGVFISAGNTFYLGKEGDFLKQISFGAWEYFLTFFHFFFPRLGVVNKLSESILNKEPLQDLNLPLEILHFLGSYSLLWVLLIFLFKKKEHSTF